MATIPESSSTVDVRVIDTNTLLYLRTGLFWETELQGFEGLDAPTYCFLVSHGSRHVVFDLGVRTDWENYAPKIVQLIKATTTVTPGLDVASVLDSDVSGLQIRSTDIEAVIWSHNHFDHTGDPSTFQPSTQLVVGPGVKTASWPGYPSNPDAGVLDADAAGREVREITFAGTPPRVGGFDAFDYFGDGSFYLLDAPGHAIGHMCALARTTADPPSFVFMGADACHHAGIIRPSEKLRIPQQCPCAGLWTNPEQPLLRVPHGPIFADHAAATDTVRKIQELDALSEVFVILAHDTTLREHIPLFPERLNDWQANGLREKTRWLFCEDFNAAEVAH
ncbi:Metallo-hydrolase/oxidoreductase [Hypomontagnella monticulosa]|nr:Metallo-hydrolase/oxidoreductase [Hypomontagnella monticulosa]